MLFVQTYNKTKQSKKQNNQIKWLLPCNFVPQIIEYLGQGDRSMKINFTKKIKERIDNFNNNKVFISSDFIDIADYETVRKTLNRLTNSEKIQKIVKGIYYNPKYTELIEEYEAPSVHEVAKVIARKYNWTIAPSGNTALNLLGLST